MRHQKVEYRYQEGWSAEMQVPIQRTVQSQEVEPVQSQKESAGQKSWVCGTDIEAEVWSRQSEAESEGSVEHA